MEINELVKLAEAGDVYAMLELGDYYKEKNSFDNMGRAAYWYNQAALEGKMYGMINSMVIHPVLAYVKMAVGDWNAALEAWDITYKRAQEVITRCEELKNEFDTSEERELALDTLVGYPYGVARCYFGLREDESAVEVLRHSEDMKECVLRGVCLFRSSNYSDAFKDIKKIENLDYVNMKKDPDEEHVYALAARQLSGTYRLGLSGIVKADVNAAVKVLQTAYANINDDDCKQLVKKELDRYQKKMLGGYKYIG